MPFIDGIKNRLQRNGSKFGFLTDGNSVQSQKTLNMMDNTVINLKMNAVPDDTDAVNVQYVRGVSSFHEGAYLIATTALSLTAGKLHGTYTIDGTSSGNAKRILVTANGVLNGLWVSSTSGDWTRATDWTTAYEFVAGEGVQILAGSAYINTIFGTTNAGITDTNTPVFANVAAGKGYTDTKVAKAGDTMTGNLTITNTNPTFTLDDTDSSPADQTATLSKHNNVLQLTGQVPANPNLGKYLYMGTKIPHTTGTAVTPGDTFTMLGIGYAQAWNQFHCHITKKVGGVDRLFGMFPNFTSIYAHGSGNTGQQVYVGASHTAVTVAGYYHSAAVIFDTAAGTISTSWQDEPFVEGTNSNGYLGAGFATFTEGDVCFNSGDNSTTLDSHGYQAATWVADFLIIDGAITDADVAWYYNGGLGRASADIETRFGGNILVHWNFDQAATPTTSIVENHVGGGTYDLTWTGGGTLTTTAIPATMAFGCNGVTVQQSDTVGYIGDTILGQSEGESHVFGQEVNISPYDGAGTDVDVLRATYDHVKFLAGTTLPSSAPATPAAGDIYWDDATGKLKVYQVTGTPGWLDMN